MDRASPVPTVPPPRAGGARTLGAFRDPQYRRLWSANVTSYVSRWMQMTMLGWLVLELTESAFQVALVGFFAMAPMLVLGVFGGLAADRFDRRKLLLTTQSMSLAGALVMMLLLLLGFEQPWHAYGVMLVTGIGWSLDMPSRRSSMLDILGRANLTNAVALDSVGMHGSRMLGPALAGALIAAVDVSGGYVVVTAIYIVSLTLMWLVRIPSRPGQATGPGLDAASRRGVRDVFADLAAGFRYVRGNRVIMSVIVITVFMNLLLFPYIQVIPVIAVNVLEVEAFFMGLLLAADGMGALVGSVFIASAAGLRHHGRVYLVGSLVGLFMVLLFSFSRSYGLSLLLLLLMGLGTAGFGTMQSAIVMLVAREDMRGRALGVMTLAIGAGPLGALLIGAVASVKGPTFAIALNAVIGLIAVGGTGLVMRSLWGRIVADEGETSAMTQVSPARETGN